MSSRFRSPVAVGIYFVVGGLVICAVIQLGGFNKTWQQMFCLVGGASALGGTIISCWPKFNWHDGNNRKATLFWGPAFIGAGTLLAAIAGFFS